MITIIINISFFRRQKWSIKTTAANGKILLVYLCYFLLLILAKARKKENIRFFLEFLLLVTVCLHTHKSIFSWDYTLLVLTVWSYSELMFAHRIQSDIRRWKVQIFIPSAMWRDCNNLMTSMQWSSTFSMLLYITYDIPCPHTFCENICGLLYTDLHFCTQTIVSQCVVYPFSLFTFSPPTVTPCSRSLSQLVSLLLTKVMTEYITYHQDSPYDCMK